jgi:2-polyprenyl-3-methyl-5-hydroxy-6-metoxy-1,4-benzoquinol methylase
LQALEKFTFHQETIEQTVPTLESESVDVVMLISVLEHLNEPQFVVQSAWRLLRLRPAFG